jgi:hypothetical protein
VRIIAGSCPVISVVAVALNHWEAVRASVRQQLLEALFLETGDNSWTHPYLVACQHLTFPGRYNVKPHSSFLLLLFSVSTLFSS